MSESIYAVSGVTGNTGRATANALLDAGERVRVVVRSEEKGAAWAQRGAEVAVADLSDETALTAALRGTAGAYLLLPPQWSAADPLNATEALAQTLADAARAAGVPHVVLLSSVGAQHPDGTGPIAGLHRAETVFRTAGVPTTFLRAAYFLENWLMVLPAVTGDGALPTFVASEQAIPMVAVADIGHAAAKALLDPAPSHRIVELASAEDWTPRDVAAAFGAALGREVAVSAAPPEAAREVMAGMGVPPVFAALYAEMYVGIASGRVAWTGSPTRGATELSTWATGVLEAAA